MSLKGKRFHPQRKAVLLVGADKRVANQKRFYKDLVRKAEDRYQKHLMKCNMEVSHGKNF